MGQTNSTINGLSGAWQGFRLAHDRVVDRLDSDLSDSCEMTLAEYEVLASLYEASGHQLRMYELAELTRLSPSGLTRRFDMLVRRGWVTRERCDDDRRGVVATLTREGAKKVKVAVPIYEQGTRDYFFDVLGERSTKTIGSAMAKLAKANEA